MKKNVGNKLGLSDRILSKIYRRGLYNLFYSIFPQGSNVFYWGNCGDYCTTKIELDAPAILWRGKNPYVSTTYSVETYGKEKFINPLA